MHDEVVKRFRGEAPAVDFWSLRIVEERVERTMVRNGVAEPVTLERDLGAMVSVIHGGGIGYAGTSDLSAGGLREAAARATAWAEQSAGRLVLDTDVLPRPSPQGEYESPVERPWFEVPMDEKLAALERASDVAIDDRLVERRAAFWFTQADTRLITSAGGDISQRLHLLAPLIEVIANEGTESQQRSLGVDGRCQQGGWEVLDRVGFGDKGQVLAEEAVGLLDAENCPTGTMDLLLHPDQMMLQIHESIGHPIELDRILGDERNYAGRSFVSLDMFGSYPYGSELLNVTYDPTRERQFASYAWDDEGEAAERVFLIEKGILKRGIGGASSQARAGVAGTASARASSWNRPPIDRMSNLNVEAGDTSFEDLVKQTERGVFMRTNKSWSIDDSRNKFQFGCQWGQLIEDGELTRVVKNPNYRGVSASYWRALKGVGDDDSFRVLGEPFCGKGEPNQLIRVGHASPACLFGDIAVFGAE